MFSSEETCTWKSLDLLSLFWLVSSVLIASAHVVLHLPTSSIFRSSIDLLKPLYYFGKLQQIYVKNNDSNTGLLRKFIIAFSSFPKRWFSHFYVTGFFVHSLIFLFLILLATNTVKIPESVQEILVHLHCFESQETTHRVQKLFPVLVVFACEEIHMLRRIYECCFISSFSNGTISIIHYFYGVAFYVMFGFGILVSLPIHHLYFSYAIDSSDAIFIGLGVVGFFVASYLQHKVMRTFAALRLKEKDEQAKGHYIPRGHLFHWVSSPHYLCEISLYLSLCLILRWENTYLVCSTVFVLVNQVCAGLSVHSWYRETFHNYPKSRKALFPYML